MADSNSRKRGPAKEGGVRSKKQRKPDDICIKFLLPNVVVGALLSKKAASIRHIKDQTCREVELILSGRDQFYPGTHKERMIALTGTPPMIHRACCLLQDQIIDDPFLVTDEAGTTEHGPRQGQLKIVVSDRAASKIIGQRGVAIKDISSHFNIAINITPPKEVIVKDERVVTILGPSHNVYDALEPIIYHITQSTQVKAEFDYYDEINKKLSEEKKESSDAKQDEATAQETTAEEATAEEATAEEATSEEATAEEATAEEATTEENNNGIKKEVLEEASDKAETTDANTNNIKEESETVSKEESNEEKPKKEDPEKVPSKDMNKKTKKAPKKDGQWVWQSDSRSKRPSWVWVENKPQKNQFRRNQRPMNRRY